MSLKFLLLSTEWPGDNTVSPTVKILMRKACQVTNLGVHYKRYNGQLLSARGTCIVTCELHSTSVLRVIVE